MKIVLKGHVGKEVDLDSIYRRFRLFGLEASLVIPVSFFSSRQAFDVALELRTPEWVIASQDDSSVYILEPSLWNPSHCSSCAEEIITHEVAHVLFVQQNTDAPLWAFEGFAMLVAGQVDLRRADESLAKNPYEASYGDPDFYGSVEKTMAKLAQEVGEPRLVTKIYTCHSFTVDSLLGTSHLQGLVDSR